MQSQETQIVLSEFRLEMTKLREEVEAGRKETRDLVEAWNTAMGVVKFVKFLSTFMAALGALYLFISHAFHWPKG